MLTEYTGTRFIERPLPALNRKEMTMKEIYKISEQGIPIINDVWVVYQTKRVVLIEIDMESKYCKINTYLDTDEEVVPGILIYASLDDIKLSNIPTRNAESTMVIFPRFAGYVYFSSSTSRYTVHICLIKEV
jgi:hypothetical protein